MGAAYPVAYRPSAYRSKPGPSFQGGRGVRVNPANDVAGIPRPGNDNPRLGPNRAPAIRYFGRYVAPVERQRALVAVAGVRRALRLVPYVSLGLNAWTIYQQWEQLVTTGQSPMVRVMGPWRLVKTCLAGPGTRWSSTTTSGLQQCLVGQSIVGNPLTQLVPPSVERIVLWERYVNSLGSMRSRTVQTFERDSVGISASAPPYHAWLPNPMSGVVPTLRDLVRAYDAFSLPIAEPVPVPRPAPYRVIPYIGPNPCRSDREQSHRGYDIHPRLKPSPGRGFEVALRPGAKVQPRPVSKPVPAGPRTKERKTVVAITGVVATIVNFTTESLDVLDAFYDALPEHIRGKRRRSPENKARLLYRHWNDVDLTAAVKNLLANEVEDRLIGAAGRKSRELTRTLWEKYGLRGQFLLGPAL